MTVDIKDVQELVNLPVYNVCTESGEIMLVCWTTSYRDVVDWLNYYKYKYKPGKPYPNGEGVYPNRQFHIITSCGPRSDIRSMADTTSCQEQ